MVIAELLLLDRHENMMLRIIAAGNVMLIKQIKTPLIYAYGTDDHPNRLFMSGMQLL